MNVYCLGSNYTTSPSLKALISQSRSRSRSRSRSSSLTIYILIFEFLRGISILVQSRYRFGSLFNLFVVSPYSDGIENIGQIVVIREGDHIT